MDNICKFETQDILHVKNGDIEYLQFKKLKKYEDKLLHLITLRHGGVSTGGYSSLNFRSVGNDEKENVMKNLNIVCDKLNIDSNNIFKGKQNHTDNILIINSNNKQEYKFCNFSKKEIDGYICNTKNIGTLVTTADCNPIFIYDPIRNVYANVHSGWKGTLKQIYLKAIKLLIEKFNSNVQDIIVCIGPSIRNCCFSSEDEEFKKQFIKVWNSEDENNYIFYEENKKRFHIDMIYLIQKDLLNIGIKNENISVADICTVCNHNDFYSYRKATQNKLSDYGTMANIMYLK